MAVPELLSHVTALVHVLGLAQVEPQAGPQRPVTHAAQDVAPPVLCSQAMAPMQLLLLQVSVHVAPHLPALQPPVQALATPVSLWQVTAPVQPVAAHVFSQLAPQRPGAQAEQLSA